MHICKLAIYIYTEDSLVNHHSTESFTLVFIATVLLFSQQVEAQQVEVPADAAAAAAAVCRTGEAAKSLLECRATFLQFAGENFTDDCEEGIIQEFMTCITAIEECRNVSAFVEKSTTDAWTHQL